MPAPFDVCHLEVGMTSAAPRANRKCGAVGDERMAGRAREMADSLSKVDGAAEAARALEREYA